MYSLEARSFASISEIDIPLSHPAKTMANNRAANGLKARAPCSFFVIFILLVIVVIFILVVEVVIVLVVKIFVINFVII